MFILGGVEPYILTAIKHCEEDPAAEPEQAGEHAPRSLRSYLQGTPRSLAIREFKSVLMCLYIISRVID